MRSQGCWLVIGCLAVAACGSAEDGFGGSGGSSSAGAAGGAGAGVAGGAAGQAGSNSGGSSGNGGSGGGEVGDPASFGPFSPRAETTSVEVSATGSRFDMLCEIAADAPAPMPTVVFLHGFQLPASQYRGYLRHLASFGYVACAPDYPAGFSANNLQNARDAMGSLDHLLAASADASTVFGGLVDGNKLGLAGHSLGGKVAVITASMDPRVKAVLGVDPVDGAIACNPTNCPDASQLLPLPIPTAFLGELLDRTGTPQACAPEADNYQTFFARAGAPSVEITVNGANHMSFLDDPASCGLTCSFCRMPTADHGQVIGMSYAMTAAFFRRHLEGLTGYDTYLSGDLAQERYVQPGLVSLRAKL